MLSLIAAVAENNVIGKKNDLPWYIPRDLKHFSETTRKHTVIMGRNTYNSIIARINKPLPDRRNIVISSQGQFEAPGCEVVTSLDEAKNKLDPEEENFVIGGAQLYQATLPLADRLYITHVHASIDGDAFFPKISSEEWNIISEEHYNKDEKNQFGVTFKVYERKK